MFFLLIYSPLAFPMLGIVCVSAEGEGDLSILLLALLMFKIKFSSTGVHIKPNTISSGNTKVI
jgi:hypothetical protein